MSWSRSWLRASPNRAAPRPTTPARRASREASKVSVGRWPRAERAGLTERTFFRHFADKREVLFSGSAALQELLVERVAGAPDATSPIAAVGAALEAAGAVLQERGEWSQQRQAVIAANAELRERELIKLASLASALAEALRRRGVKEPVARLTAEAGIAAFKVAFERWVQRPSNRSLPRLIHESFDQLKAVAAGR